MITDRDDLLELALDVHDCANSVRRGVGLPKFAGYNFRASELTGRDGAGSARQARRLARADAREPCAPLRRDQRSAGVDAPPRERRRRRRRHRADRIRRRRGTRRRGGRRAQRGRRARDADLLADDARSSRLSVLGSRPRGARGRRRRPAPDCPRTLDLLERTIHVDVSPLCEEQDLDEIAFAFEKVAKQVLA